MTRKLLTDAALHLASVVLRTAILTLFPVLHYHPRFLSKTYSFKDTQQLANFIIIGLGLLLSELFSRCLR